MKSHRNITVVGIGLVILSPLVGIIGAAWSVYGSFDALSQSEAAGIGLVGGSQIEQALIFSICGILGATVGVLMIVFGTRKARKR